MGVCDFENMDKLGLALGPRSASISLLEIFKVAFSSLLFSLGEFPYCLVEIFFM